MGTEQSGSSAQSVINVYGSSSCTPTYVIASIAEGTVNIYDDPDWSDFDREFKCDWIGGPLAPKPPVDKFRGFKRITR